MAQRRMLMTFRPILLTGLAALSACQPTDDGGATTAPEGVQSGVVVYRERMALPPDATVNVRLEDVSIADAPAILIAQQTSAADGRQVPIPFELRFPAERIQPNRRYSVRAEIRAASGELLFTTTTHHPVLEAGIVSTPVEILLHRVAVDRDAAPPAPEVGRTFVFDCDGAVSFTVRTGPGEVALWAPASLGGEYLVLAATPAASGARYQDGDTVFWNKGDLATFELGGQSFVDCRSNPSKAPWADAVRRGATFRALGNEPSWNLEVYPGRLVLVTDFGARRTEAAYTGAVTGAGGQTTYRATSEAGEITTVIERLPCADTMSGESFEAAVTVTFEERILYGCGRFL